MLIIQWKTKIFIAFYEYFFRQKLKTYIKSKINDIKTKKFILDNTKTYC